MLFRINMGFFRTSLTGEEGTAANTDDSHTTSITSFRLYRFEKEIEKEIRKIRDMQNNQHLNRGYDPRLLFNTSFSSPY